MQLFAGNLEETVLDILFRKGSLSTLELLNMLQKKPNSVTKQGMYRVLRKLKEEEKIIIHKSIVSVNNFWIDRLKSIISDISDSKTSIIGNVLDLGNGEKLTLKVKSLTHFDRIWSHLFLNIEEHIPVKFPLYLFNPHNITIVFREETDRIHASRLSKKQRPVFLVIGGSSEMDRETLKMAHEQGLQCLIDTKIKSNEYIAVLGDYIIRVVMSSSGNALVDNAFKESQTIEILRSKIEGFDQKIISKIIIEKNTAKALVWKKRLAQGLYVPKGNRDF